MTAPIIPQIQQQEDPFADAFKSQPHTVNPDVDPFADAFKLKPTPTIGGQFVAGMESTSGAISKTLGRAASWINQKASDLTGGLIGNTDHNSFFTGVATKLNADAATHGEAVTGAQKVSRFLGGAVAQLPLGMGVGSIASKAIAPIAESLLSGTAASIAANMTANKAFQAGISSAITSIPSEVIGGITAQGIVDPSSLATPGGIATAGGLSLVGSVAKGIMAGRDAAKGLATLMQESAPTPAGSPPVPKTIDPSLAPKLYAQVSNSIDDLKQLMNSDRIFNTSRLELDNSPKPTFNPRPNLATESGDIGSTTSKGFAGFGKKGVSPKTRTPISDEQLTILNDGNKIVENIQSKSKELLKLQRQMEVDGESVDKWNQIASLKDQISGHMEDYQKEILPYVVPEAQNTSTKFGVLKGEDGKVRMNLGKTQPDMTNVNAKQFQNPLTDIQPDSGPTPFLVYGKPYAPPINPNANPSGLTYNQAPPAPGVPPLNRYFGGKNNPPPPPVVNVPVGAGGNTPKSALDIVRDYTSTERPKIPNALNILGKAEADFVNYKSPLKMLGNDVNDPDLPFQRALRLSGSSDRAHQNLAIQPMLPDGKGNYVPADAISMNQVFKIGGTSDQQIADVNAYLNSKQIIDGRLKTALTTQQAQGAINELQISNPAAIQAGEEIFKRTKVQAEYLRRKVGDNIADAWIQADYAPANRNLNMDGGKLGFLTKRKGGDERVFSPVERHIENTATAISAADKTELWQSIHDLVRTDAEKWAGKIESVVVDPAKDPAFLATLQQIQQTNPDIAATVAEKVAGLMSSLQLDKTNRTVTFTDKGTIRRLMFHEDFAPMLEGMAGSEVPLGGIGQIIRKAESIPRAIFSIANDTVGMAPLRDIIESVSNDPNVKGPMGMLKAVFVDPIRAIKAIATESPQYQQVLAGGGGIGGRFVSPNSASEQNTMHYLLNRANGKMLNPVEALQHFSGLVSQVSRMGAALRVFDKGGTADQAAQMFRHVIADPQQVGAKLQSISKITAFMNMGIQSNVKAISEATTNPISLAAKGMTLVGAPSAVLWWFGKDDKDIQNLRQSKGGEQYWYMRATPESSVIAIKKPFLYGQVFGTGVEMALDKLNDSNPRAAKQFMEGVLTQMAINTMPLSVQSMSEGLSGVQSMGLGQGSVPIGGATANEMAGDIRTNNTTTFARKIGDVTGISAAWIDNAVRTFATTEGQRAINYADRVLTNRTAPSSQDLPLIGGFLPNTARSNLGGLTNFYEKANKYSDVLKSFQNAEQMGDGSRLNDIATNHKPELQQALIYADALKSLSEINKTIKIINENSLMTPSERRTKVDELQLAANDFALRFNAAAGHTIEDSKKTTR